MVVASEVQVKGNVKRLPIIILVGRYLYKLEISFISHQHATSLLPAQLAFN